MHRQGRCVRQVLRSLGERTSGTVSIQIETVVADDHAVVLPQHTASHGGRTLDVDVIDSYVIRDGWVVEARRASYDPYGTNAFLFLTGLAPTDRSGPRAQSCTRASGCWTAIRAVDLRPDVFPGQRHAAGIEAPTRWLDVTYSAAIHGRRRCCSAGDSAFADHGQRPAVLSCALA
jgi:hypothetical protein